MAREPVFLTVEQRRIVGRVIRLHRRTRNWTLHALNVLSTHVHVVVTASVATDVAISQFKGWCSRRLNESVGKRPEWWSGGGDQRPIRDEAHLVSAIRYVMEGREEAPLNDDESEPGAEPGAQATG